ncbi:MAG: hypothetical protein Harvfovirus23_3 [Harvfovirus sp.]|uniref:Uncharacterized protein n=1 Tax=Harvfovirus sp. TaxID=2487768 RepID=A0A3G5A4V6_9VIRU|nr:MAG: hypothetical protein Harvfovirus23_3 [Harvfovirus sp.]
MHLEDGSLINPLSMMTKENKKREKIKNERKTKNDKILMI